MDANVALFLLDVEMDICSLQQHKRFHCQLVYAAPQWLKPQAKITGLTSTF